jgi:hypothetical protein
MPLMMNDPGPRGTFRYSEPSISFALPESLFSVDQSVNPLGFLAGIPAITNILNYGKDTPLPFGAEDIAVFGRGAKQQVHSNVNAAQQNLLSSLYGKGLYQSGQPLGDVANLEGQRANLLANVDDQLAALMMALNQTQLQSNLAQRERQGDIGELFGNLALTLPFML